MELKYFTMLIKLLTGTKITDPTSGLRMVNREIIEFFAEEYPKDYPEPESVVAILRRKKKSAGNTCDHEGKKWRSIFYFDEKNQYIT